MAKALALSRSPPPRTNPIFAYGVESKTKEANGLFTPSTLSRLGCALVGRSKVLAARNSGAVKCSLAALGLCQEPADLRPHKPAHTNTVTHTKETRPSS
mmetsp:Transcript_17270/g.30434  ORF Transcript_17270/g.30434 Transcript_17270/m.30434 type:complete len:99 (+) Transcript_17270:290-586(+)